MNVVLRGVRVIDPLAGLDATAREVWIRDGLLMAVDKRIHAPGATLIDLSPRPGREPLVLCPAFIDLHAHLREPGEEATETVASGAGAAAAGGFGQVVAMANTRPPVDSPARVGEARARAARARARVLTAASVTRDLRGERLTDIHGCAAAGAAAFSDDGRNAAPPRLLAQALASAADVGRAVLVHPEDEAMVQAANPGVRYVVRCPERPEACEVAAVESALRALADAGRGRLHLQHISTAGAVAVLREARFLGVDVTAEVTPHHLSMWLPFEVEADPPGQRKVNPPLRSQADREAVVQALRDGLIDAVATDHAPHAEADKRGDYADAAPGITGLQTAFAVCTTLGGMGGDWLAVLIARLTAGPWQVQGPESGLLEPRLRETRRATLTLLETDAGWVVGEEPWHSLSRNTPLLGTAVRGRALLTMVDGQVTFLEPTSALVAGFAVATGVA